MYKLILINITIVSLMLFSCSRKEDTIKTINIEIEAPFEMDSITIPDFENCKELVITDFGAQENNLETTTQAISKAINKANHIGGGIVLIPKGEWLTGTIHLKSNVNLYLEEGAKLIFSENPKDYLPTVLTTWEGMECYNYSPLIYAYQCKNIAISGKGVVEARMDVWQKWFSRSASHLKSLKQLYKLSSTNTSVKDRRMVSDTSHLRPQFIQFNRCENVLLQGITIHNSPFWTIHPYLSKNVVIRDVLVYSRGRNTDGIDPEMVQNILIEKCVFDVQDDVIAVKAGRNQDAWRLNTPTKNLVIKGCKVKNGHQFLTIGSELSGGVENVFMDSCSVDNDANLKYLLYVKTNERRGGYVKNIYINNIDVDNVDYGILGIETDIFYQWRNLVPTYERRLTNIENIYLDNIHAKQVKFIAKAFGEKELPIRGVHLNNVKADTVNDTEYVFENTIDYEIQTK